jgi:hypothetical protein
MGEAALPTNSTRRIFGNLFQVVVVLSSQHYDPIKEWIFINGSPH